MSRHIPVRTHADTDTAAPRSAGWSIDTVGAAGATSGAGSSNAAIAAWLAGTEASGTGLSGTKANQIGTFEVDSRVHHDIAAIVAAARALPAVGAASATDAYAAHLAALDQFKAGLTFQKPDSAATADIGFGDLHKLDTAPPLADSDVAPLAPTLPTDPFFSQQYHLRNTAAGGRDLSIFRGDTSVWDEFTGQGVVVGIIDDGVDKNHFDLDNNYDSTLEVAGINGFHPDPDGAHGTAVAGIIAAERNGQGVVGIAYDAHIVSMPAIPAADLSGDGSVAPTIGIAQSYANYVNVDVFNNSWGYTSPYYDSFFGAAALDAEHNLLYTMASNGRDGLGTIFVKSAANGRGSADNTVGSFTNSHFGSITVAAVQRDGVISSYSTEGAGLLVSGFGGPIPGDIVTTDRTGNLGYNRTGVNDGVTGSFNGTSAAGPTVTGVVALMLDANPLLGFRDVSEILAMTAQHTGSAFGGALLGQEHYSWEWNHADNWNGGAMHFSEDYGFGLVDALAAVRLAESWTEQQTYSNFIQAGANATQSSVVIADNATVSMTFVVTGDVRIDRVGIDIKLQHTYSADLEIVLISPDGTVSQLMQDNFGSTDLPTTGAGVPNITFASTAFMGEMSAGTWTLQITDDASGDTGTASLATLYALGTSSTSSANDTYVYTEELSDYVTVARQSLGDTDGGTDIVNTSAVFTAVTVDLRAGGVSTIDGVSVTTVGATIENAVTGDGNDTLIGNGLTNELRGMRGNDTYRIDGAADRVLEKAGQGTDAVYSSVSYALLAGQSIEVLRTNNGAGTAAINLTGNEIAQYLFGNAGANALNGLGGADTMTGYGGNDGYVVDVAGDRVIEASGQGTDTVFAASSYTLQAGQSIEDLRTTNTSGTGAINLTGNEVAQHLYGNAGANALNGLGGADTMTGFRGNDAYAVDNAGDQVIEAASQGTDTVLASVSYALSAGQSIEDLRTTNTAGTGAIKLTGNEVAQNLYGNQGANTLNGLGGADTMTGFGGNDSYLVDVAGDRVVEAAGGGTDIVYASTSYTLGAGQSVEVLRTFSDAGTTATNLTGNEQANMLIGNAGINILDGGAGKDSLTPGNDSAVDTIRFSAVSHSTSVNRDTVTGMDFNEDKLDFTIVPTAFAVVTVGALNEGATFDANLATAVNAALAVNGAVLLDPNGGNLNMAGHYYLVVDGNGDGSYTAGSDYVLQIVNPTGTLDLTDFV